MKYQTQFTFVATFTSFGEQLIAFKYFVVRVNLGNRNTYYIMRHYVHKTIHKLVKETAEMIDNIWSVWKFDGDTAWE